MYIQVTIDLQHYTGEVFDLRLSNYHTVKNVIDIVWQVKNISVKPREGYWVKISNKERVHPGYVTLLESEITNGDRVEIL